MTTRTGQRLRQVAADLWETPTDSPFPGLTTHAYLWGRDGAPNVLFYSVATDNDLGELADLGGVGHQYLSHRDEAGPMLEALHARFGTVLHASALEAEDVARHRRPDVLFGAEETDANGVHVLPTPGHSPGSTCFVVDGTDGRYLFVGDTIYRSTDGMWSAGNLPGVSDAAALRASLDLLAGVRPDLVVSSAFGDGGAHRVDEAGWEQLLAEARNSLG